MTVSFAALFLLITATISIACAVAFAVAYWREASPSTRGRKSPPAPPATRNSDERLAKLEAEMVELFSTLESITTSVKRLSARSWKREQREGGSEHQAPPHGASKAQLRAYYGIGPAPPPPPKE